MRHVTLHTYLFLVFFPLVSLVTSCFERGDLTSAFDSVLAVPDEIFDAQLELFLSFKIVDHRRLIKSRLKLREQFKLFQQLVFEIVQQFAWFNWTGETFFLGCTMNRRIATL